MLNNDILAPLDWLYGSVCPIRNVSSNLVNILDNLPELRGMRLRLPRPEKQGENKQRKGKFFMYIPRLSSLLCHVGRYQVNDV